MPFRLAPCDLGDPGWEDPWFPHGDFVALPVVSAAIPCRDDTMLSSLA